MRSSTTLHIAGGLLAALALTAFSGAGAGAETDPTAVATAVEPSGPTYTSSVYAEQPRPLPTTTTTTTTAPPPTTTTAPPPPPPPPPAPAGSVDEIINRYFGASAGRAKAIAYCESKMDPNAVSPTNDHGLFQINHVHRGKFESVTGAPWSSVYDPEMNTKYAKWLFDQQGWSPWACNRKV